MNNRLLDLRDDDESGKLGKLDYIARIHEMHASLLYFGCYEAAETDFLKAIVGHDWTILNTVQTNSVFLHREEHKTMIDAWR